MSLGLVLGVLGVLDDESSGHGGLPIISQSFNYSDTKWYYIAGSIGRLAEFVQLAAVLTAGAGYFYPLIVCVSVDKHTENTSLQVGWLGQPKTTNSCQGLFFSWCKITSRETLFWAFRISRNKFAPTEIHSCCGTVVIIEVIARSMQAFSSTAGSRIGGAIPPALMKKDAADRKEIELIHVPWIFRCPNVLGNFQ